MTAIAASGASPLGSQQEGQTNSLYAGYVPHDLKYSTAFEDSLMHVVLEPTGTGNEGIRIISEDSDEQGVAGASTREEQISLPTLPFIHEDELPLSLEDSRRIYSSPIPGVKMTHPGGYLEGGPGLDPEMDTFPDDFFQNHPNIRTSAQLQKAVKKDVDASLEHLKERLRARKKAKGRNEQIEKELKTLTDQHSMESRIHNKMQEDRRKKREEKEKRRRDREGGSGG